MTIGSNWVNHGQAVHLGGRQVVCAKGRGQVNQTRAIFNGDIIRENDVISGLVHRHKGIKRLILRPFQLLPLEGIHDFDVLTPEDFFNQILRKD